MSQPVKNPFLHQHDHDHDHHHHHHDHDGDGELIEQLDPAQQSLADALRVSFFVLKMAMLLLLVVYLLSGIFWVAEHENAVRLRFGALVGEPGEQVYSEGWHFGLPYPIEQVIRVPDIDRTVELGGTGADGTFRHAFMPEQLTRARQLNPQRDGSLITGDANVVHGQFSVNYRIEDAAQFVQAIDDLELATDLVRAVAEQSILYTVARTDADTFLGGNLDLRTAESRANRILREMEIVPGRPGTGIALRGFTSRQEQPPGAAARAFEEVTRAESSRSQMIEAARQEQSRILGEAAGEAALPLPDGSRGPLLALILEYEHAAHLGDQAEVERLDALLDASFRELRVPVDPAAPEAASVAIGAEAARAIQTARSYASGIVQRIRAEAETVTELGQQDATHRRLLETRRWQEARQRIFTTEDVETFYAMPGRMYLTTNRDPRIREERERRRLQEERENR